MTSNFIRPFIPFLCAAAAFVGAGNVFAGPLTGVPGVSGDGWTSIGNSRDTTNVIYARGGTTDFNTYITNFTLAAGDSFTGSGFQGSAGGALVSGGWLVGDRIIGLGINSASKLNSATFKFDFGGTGTWAPASAVDGPSGVGSFGFGGNGSIQGQSIQSASTFAPQDNQYKDLAGVVHSPAPAAGSIDYESALRAWAVLDTLDPFNYHDMEWLVNYDELLRLNMPVAPIGAISKFVVNASGPIAGLPAGNNEGADVAFSSALAFPGGTVPEPGSLALVALALLVGVGVARRRA